MGVLAGPDPPAGLDPDVAYPATGSEMGVSDRHAVAEFLAYGALRRHFAGRPGCYVGQDRNLYYRPGDNKTFVEPDVFVCFGPGVAALEGAVSYRLWEVGAPAFVLEVASDSTAERDRGDEPAIYLEVGAAEYWRFDPTGGDLLDPALQGERLVSGAWAAIEVAPDGEGRLRGASRSLGLDLHAEEGRLRFRDPRSGEWLDDPDDLGDRLDVARARATAAEDQAKAAQAARNEEADARSAAEDRAAAAEAEVAALRARLDDRNGDTAP